MRNESFGDVELSNDHARGAEDLPPRPSPHTTQHHTTDTNMRSCLLRSRWTRHTTTSLSSRRRFSTEELPQSTPTSLGLIPPIVAPALETITALPEISSALNDLKSSQEGLERALDIFVSMGGTPHQVTLALLAECRQQNETDAGPTLEALAKLLPGNQVLEDVQLAQAKVKWLQGDFRGCQEICERLVDETQSPLHHGAARTGQAVARLLALETLDDAFSVRDPARMVVKAVERYHGAALPLVAAQLNVGVAEAIYAERVQQEHGVTVPLDPALRAWKAGLTLLKRHDRKNRSVAMLEARLRSNMAWAMLEMDYTKQASEFAGKALEVYDKRLAHDDVTLFPRLLTLVATCYHRTHQAVTAEGLFQTAMDDTATDLLHRMNLRDAHRGYAKLCQEWEKRERDAETHTLKAEVIDQSLPEGWRGKSAIHAQLWFWTPYTF